MSDGASPGGRDSRGRFKKGESPNPKGRPRKTPELPVSSLDVIFDRTVTVTTLDGKRRKLSAKEAIELQTLKDAMAGKARAINQITAWLISRERWIQKEAQKRLPEQQNIPARALAAVDTQIPKTQ